MCQKKALSNIDLYLSVIKHPFNIALSHKCSMPVDLLSHIYQFFLSFTSSMKISRCVMPFFLLCAISLRLWSHQISTGKPTVIAVSSSTSNHGLVFLNIHSPLSHNHSTKRLSLHLLSPSRTSAVSLGTHPSSFVRTSPYRTSAYNID